MSFRKQMEVTEDQDGKQLAEPIIVYEISPRHVGSVLLMMDDIVNIRSENDVFNLMAGRWDTVVNVLKDCTSLGAKIEGVGGAFLLVLIKKFIEVNKTFFENAMKLNPLQRPVEAPEAAPADSPQASS